ncbi:hypothetical protein E2C01_020992 [Portunus trituberculatus]|uniref:Uncharacterized protein n=1 Tax=Portunus trituberculatus TaxID=210409 RepID=A0A5B7E322_PORTR|nr:hypothetical protein [Portunus trituberculatus]
MCQLQGSRHLAQCQLEACCGYHDISGHHLFLHRHHNLIDCNYIFTQQYTTNAIGTLHILLEKTCGLV